MAKLNTKVLWIGGLSSAALLVVLAAGFRFDPRVISSPLIGKPAPHFTLPTLDGGRVALADLRPKPVVVNFWSSWCIPCIAEHKVLLSAARRHRENVHFVP